MTSVLVFGGSFDPVHIGHLSIAAQARELTGAAEVWFVPAAVAPMRDHLAAAPEDRLALLGAATGDQPHTRVLDLAVRIGGVSYTAETMDALRREHPLAELAVLVGADAARTIPAWHRAADLLALEHFVVVNRTGPPPLDTDELSRLGFAPSSTTLLSVDSPNISASDVRRRCADGRSLAGLVPDAVAALIAEKGMYRSNLDDA
ncbi:MAG TPA: nicotinate (nicotinamide) nucleotide adenylyltransferase [Candidatus Saccharimonadales bacterium]|jgi:nicotinate-nucleotide adenylyltransferase|nr:nicotinate (nicotinamide) nucleotide adenylyltransferase [Candidatus Saccharimonadales bacterium]